MTGIPDIFHCLRFLQIYILEGNKQVKFVLSHPKTRRCLHFEVVRGFDWSNDPESYAGGNVATGRASLAGKVKGDDPD
jgi:hypothetical protein